MYNTGMRLGRLAPLLVLGISCSPSTPPSRSVETTPVASVDAASSPSTSSAGSLPMLLLPSEPTGSAGSGPPVLHPPTGPQPPCATDEDCWSYTCCPPKLPNECVHHSLAQKCSLIDMTCPKEGSTLKCVCLNHACETKVKG